MRYFGKGVQLPEELLILWCSPEKGVPVKDQKNVDRHLELAGGVMS